MTADAFVRDGDHADANFGSHSQLQWKSGSQGFARQAFIAFDVAELEDVESATLWLHGRVSGGAAAEYPDSIATHVYEVDPAEWSESEITWNSKPDVSGDSVAEFTFDVAEGEAAGWHSVDLTDLVTAAVGDGDEALGVALVRHEPSGPMPQMGSRESGYGPVLEINGTPGTSEPEPPIEGPVRSELYPEDWHPGMVDDEGRFLHDFS